MNASYAEGKVYKVKNPAFLMMQLDDKLKDVPYIDRIGYKKVTYMVEKLKIVYTKGENMKLEKKEPGV